jgi:hypothetical protein
MHTQSPNRVRPAHGLAFPVHELVFMHAWSQGQGLTMSILLDQVLNGAEFEEMVLVRGRGARGRALTLWRVAAGGVVVQAEGGAPHVFGGIHTALSHAGALFAAMPARVPSVWRRLLGWGRA